METSPHTRGKQAVATQALTNNRNIPAYAGKAAYIPSAGDSLGKHPRIRGESHNILNQ